MYSTLIMLSYGILLILSWSDSLTVYSSGLQKSSQIKITYSDQTYFYLIHKKFNKVYYVFYVAGLLFRYTFLLPSSPGLNLLEHCKPGTLISFGQILQR